jgi:hypothetical protein
MSTEAVGDEPVDPGELRASHADRDKVVEALRVAGGDGRLTAAELDERLEQALTASTYAELARLVRDLPPGKPPEIVVPADAAGLAADGVLSISHHHANARQDGPWVVPRRIEVHVESGHVRLDFTQAVITRPALEITINISSGTLTLLTRPGVTVDASDVAVSGGTVRIRAGRGQDVPAVLAIRVSGQLREGHLRSREHRTRRLRTR